MKIMGCIYIDALKVKEGLILVHINYSIGIIKFKEINIIRVDLRVK